MVMALSWQYSPTAGGAFFLFHDVYLSSRPSVSRFVS